MFDTSKEGLETLMKPYKVALMEHIWEINEKERTGTTSGQAHIYLTETGDRELMKSRAAVCFFLDDMVEEGVLEFELKTGKGGHHRVYFPAMNREEYGQYVTETITNKLKEVFASSRNS